MAYLHGIVERAAPPAGMAISAPRPSEALQAFSLRMGQHGMSVSCTLMMHDRRYALEQLNHAHALADEALRQMAVTLFGQLELPRHGPDWTA